MLFEDSHLCLKSGCRIEERQGPRVDGLIRLLGLLSPLAVRLVQIRGYARSEPERPAHEVIEPLLLAVVARRSGQSPLIMTVGSDLGWRSHAWVASLSRSHDGPPGWRTMWKGWLSQATFLEGVSNVNYLGPPYGNYFCRFLSRDLRRFLLKLAMMVGFGGTIALDLHHI